LSNLLLRLNRYGRLLLTKEQIAASNLVGGLLLTAAVSAVIAVMTAHKTAIIAAAGCAMLIIPVAGSFGIEKPSPRKVMFIYTGVMGFMLVAGLLLSLFGSEMYFLLIPFFVLGFMLFGWIANGINLRS